MQTGTCSVEYLVHFACGFCPGTWTIKTAEAGDMYVCPHCGACQSFKQKDHERGRGGTADAPDSESGSGSRSGGSSPLDRTKLDKVKDVVQLWMGKQGHDRCWYYPDLFYTLAAILGIRPRDVPALPPRPEFEEGCRRYQKEEYENGKPPFACPQWGGYEHDWLYCPECLTAYETMIAKETHVERRILPTVPPVKENPHRGEAADQLAAGAVRHNGQGAETP